MQALRPYFSHQTYLGAVGTHVHQFISVSLYALARVLLVLASTGHIRVNTVPICPSSAYLRHSPQQQQHDVSR